MPGVSRYSDDPPFRVIYTRPDADMGIRTGSGSRSSSKAPVMSSQSIVEVEQSTTPSRTKTTRTIMKTTSRKESASDTSFKDSLFQDTLTNSSDSLSTKTYRTSSRTGTLYFAIGSDISPSQFKSNSGPIRSSSAKPIALAKLRGWQWIISSRGVPNIVDVGEPDNRANGLSLRAKEKERDANFVYGLLYNLNYDDEGRVDRSHGYHGQGPPNINPDTSEIKRRPFLQGDNITNKMYERVDIMEWFTDPMREGINVVRNATDVKCLIYADESLKGVRPGRIWDDEIDNLSQSVTTAVKQYYMPRRWVESVMGQYGIRVLKEEVKTFRSRSRSRGRSVSERVTTTRVDGSKRESSSCRRSQRHSRSRGEDDDQSFVERKVTRRVTEAYEPLPRSDFYREKRGRPVRCYTT